MKNYDSIIENSENGLIPIEVFMKVLKPLKWVDWTSPELSVYRGGGERGRRTLQVWIEDALRNGICYTFEEVMSSDLHSLPGCGILAHPGDSEIEIISENRWPQEREPLVVSSIRPRNSMKVCTWQIFDDKDRDLTELLAKTTTKSIDDVAYLRISHHPTLYSVNSLNIRVSWRNAVEPSGKGMLKLKWQDQLETIQI